MEERGDNIDASMVFMETGSGIQNGTAAVHSDSQLTYVGHILLYAFLSGLTMITILGNTLVIVAVATTRRLRSVTNCFIVSLSVADLLVGVLVMPLSLIYDATDRWSFGVVLCELWSAMDIMLCTASILNLCCISLDRYFAITRPLTYTVKRNKRLALIMIAVVWVASSAVTCPPLLGWFDRGHSDVEQCRYVSDKGYVIFSACGSFFIPLAVMLFVYTRIFVVIYRRNKVVKQQKQYQNHHHRQHKRHCCSNGCLPDTSSPNGLGSIPAVRGGADCATTANHHHHHYRYQHHQKKAFAKKTNTSSNSECLVSLEMVSDSLLAMRPRCGSSGASAAHDDNNKRDSVGGLYRSRSYQFPCHNHHHHHHHHQTATVKAVQTSTVTATTHLLAVPQWTKGMRNTPPSSSSSGALNAATSSSAATGSAYTESTTTTTTTDTTATTKASMPIVTSDEPSTDMLRSPRPSKDGLRGRKHVRGLRMSFRKETKATTTIAVVVGGFVVCWLPFFIIYIANPFCATCNFSRLLVSALTWLGWANSAVNPFIYAFYNMDFRSAFWRLTLGRCRSPSDSDKGSKAVVVYPRVWRTRLKNGRVNGLPSIVMVQSDLM